MNPPVFIPWGKSFNSTLVQLKATEAEVATATELRFNSTLVQLKEDRTLKNGPMSTCFNSTLVQLKATESRDT